MRILVLNLPYDAGTQTAISGASGLFVPEGKKKSLVKLLIYLLSLMLALPP